MTLLHLVTNKFTTLLLDLFPLEAEQYFKCQFSRFKFLCRALAGYVLTQLPEMKGSQQVVRKTANAPSIVGQPGGNTECPKVLLKLDFGHTQGKIKQCAELALKEVLA